MQTKNNYVWKKLMKVNLPTTRNRASPKRRFIEVVKNDLKVVGMT